MSETSVNLKSNSSVAKFFDLGQRLMSLFIATALPAITGGAVLGVSVGKSALMAGFMAVVQVVQKLAQASTDGSLTSAEIAEAFGKTSKTK